MHHAPLKLDDFSSSHHPALSCNLALAWLRGIPVAGARHRARRGLRARATHVMALGPVLLASSHPAHPLLNPFSQPGDHAALIHSPPASPRPTSSGYSP